MHKFNFGLITRTILCLYLTLTLCGQYDLGLSISVPPQEIKAGQLFRIIMTVQNTGLPASGLVLTNEFSDEVQINSVIGRHNKVTRENNRFIFDIGDIGLNEALSLELQMTAPAGTLVIHGSAFALGIEEIVYNNVFTEQLQVAPGSTLPPMVAILSPREGAEIDYGSVVLIQADAFDQDGIVTKMIFYINGSAVGEVTAPPFQVYWRAQQHGAHEIMVSARDNLGASNSTTRRVKVLAPPPTKTVSLRFIAEGMELIAGAEPGRRMRLFSSRDLVTWEQIDEQVASDVLVTFKGDRPTWGSAFYRVSE